MYHTFFFLGRKSGACHLPIYKSKIQNFEKTTFIILGTFTSEEVITLYIVQEILNITVKSRILQTETKARRGFFSFLFFTYFLSPLAPFRLITPPLFVRLVSHSIPADGNTNDMSLTTSVPLSHSLTRLSPRESPVISRLRVVNVINNYVARAA